MSRFYSVSIVNDYAFILYIEEKDNTFIVLEKEELELIELKEYLRGKENLYITINPNFEFSKIIDVPVAIANSRNLKSYLLYAIKEEYPDIDILFTYQKLPSQHNNESVSYNVEVIDEKETLESLNFVHNLNNIKSVMTSKLALLSLANKCMDLECYICVYTIGTTVFIIAVEQKVLLFSRKTTVEPSAPETMQMEIVENITQTISYINNEFRDLDFKTLVLGGSIALDDVISQHIAMFNSISISILYPNSFVKALESEESQNYLLPFGTVLAPKQNRLLLKRILGLKEFNIATVTGVVLSFLVFLGVLYFTVESMSQYNELVQTNKMLKKKYEYILAQTKMLPSDKIRIFKEHIYLVKKYLKSSPLDQIAKMEPLIQLEQPVVFEYQEQNGRISLHVIFEKQFDDLMQLYTFQEQFDERFKAISFDVKLEKKIKADYKKLHYEIDLKTIDTGKRNMRQRRRQ